MVIHELNTKALTSPAYIALDDGEDTYKVDFSIIKSALDGQISSIEEAAETAEETATAKTRIFYGELASTGSAVACADFAPTINGYDFIVVKSATARTAGTFTVGNYPQGYVYANGSRRNIHFAAGECLLFRVVDVTQFEPQPVVQYHYIGKIYPEATTSESGLMSAEDKAALDQATEDIANLKSDLKHNDSQLFSAIKLPYTELVRGSITSTGTDDDTSITQRVRSGFISISGDAPIGIKVNAGIDYATYFYTSNDASSHVLTRTWGYFNDIICANGTGSDAKYIRLLFRKSTNETLKPSEIGLELTRPPKAIDEIYQSEAYRQDVIGVQNCVVGTKIVGLSSDGAEYQGAITRAVTDLLPIDNTATYSVQAFINGEQAQGLIVYYPSETGSQSSRGAFARTPINITPSASDNYFRVMLRKDNNAIFNKDDDIKVYVIRNGNTINEDINSLFDYTGDLDNRTRSIKTEQGAYDENGINTSGTTRLRSVGFIPVSYLSSLKVSIKANGNALDYWWLLIFYSDKNYSIQQTSRETTWKTNSGTSHVLDKQAKYARLYIRNSSNTAILPDDVTIEVECKKSVINAITYSPVLSKAEFVACSDRKNGQDIAVYNGDIFDFDTGKVSINGGNDIEITNGHGNNCCFGVTKHGDYPYLYCGAWNRNEPYIYVNQYDDGAFTLVKTITFQGLEGNLNACVDEENNRAYIFLNTSQSTYDGVVDFIVGDLDGNVLSRKSIDNIPVIEGMTFYNGMIIVSSGHGINYPSFIHVFDVDGNLMSKTAQINIPWNQSNWFDTIEGLDIDNVTGKMYVGLEKLIMEI